MGVPAARPLVATAFASASKSCAAAWMAAAPSAGMNPAEAWTRANATSNRRIAAIYPLVDKWSSQAVPVSIDEGSVFTNAEREMTNDEWSSEPMKMGTDSGSV